MVSNKKYNKKILSIAIRYLFLLMLVLISLPIIYSIFTPLTVYPLFIITKIFVKEVVLSFNPLSNQSPILLINSKFIIQLIHACIAGSAYLLLFILNLTVPINILKRILSLVFSLGVLLILNIVRIFLLVLLYETKNPFFDFIHITFWYFLSTIFIVLIWFFTIKIFKIKEIPVYTDIKELTKKN